MKKGLLILLFLFVFALKGQSQFLSDKMGPYYLSFQFKSENPAIVELGIIKLNYKKINWQIKTGFGGYNLKSATGLKLYNSYLSSYDFSIEEFGSTLFIKPGILFYLTKKERSKTRLILAALNIHNGLSFNEQKVQFKDAVFGNKTEIRNETKFNCAAELEIIQMFEVFDHFGTRLGLHTGWKLFNPQPFDKVFFEQGKYRNYYTPGLGNGKSFYFNLTLGIAYRL